MADFMKSAKKLIDKAKENVDVNEVKKSAKKVGEILKDGKVTKEEKKELTNIAKDLVKDCFIFVLKYHLKKRDLEWMKNIKKD